MVSKMSENRFPMKLVTHRTGLSAHVLRVWERRYEAVIPERTESNRRYYTEDEVRRLEHLALLTKAGHSISHIAQHSQEQLERLVAEIGDLPAADQSEASGGSTASAPTTAVDSLLEKAWQAVVDLDGVGLEAVLDQATGDIGGSAMIEKVVVPLICRIGSSWDSGEITVAQERVASTVIQEVLLLASRPHSESRGAPTLVIATPAGQMHELGASLVACLARRRGWAVTYLGASIPAAEIAYTVNVKNAPGVALSIVYPMDDPGMADELKRLRTLLPKSCEIVVGGAAADSYSAALEEIGALQIYDLTALKAWLDEKRKPA